MSALLSYFLKREILIYLVNGGGRGEWGIKWNEKNVRT